MSCQDVARPSDHAALEEEATRRQLVVVPAPAISLFTAEPPVGGQTGDSVYNDGVRMTIDFDSATDMGGFTFAPLEKGDVDALFLFTEPLGSDYIGQWMSNRRFTITILDWPGAGPPQIGEPFGMTCTCRTDKARSVRAAPPALSMASQSTSPKLLGAFGPPVITFVSLQAIPNHLALGDSIYGDGVGILAKFNRDTNLAGYEPVGTPLSVSQMSTFLRFSHELGAVVTAVFLDRRTLRFDIADSSGGRADIGEFYLTMLPDQPHGLRNFPAASGPMEGVSPYLSGDFGPANVFIETFKASDPDNRDIVYGAGDRMVITFNRDTNLGWGVRGNLPLQQVVLKPDIDAVFEMSQTLGANYTGIWETRARFVITIVDATGASPPGIGSLRVKILRTGNLRNFPPSAAPTESEAVLTGNWGLRLPAIISFVAADPDGHDSVYGAGDTLTMLFDRDTDTATLGFRVVTKSTVDNLFLFSRVLGADYQGQWTDVRTFVITILDPAGSRQPMLEGLFAR